MKIPFGDFTPMHSEIRQEMLTMFEDVYDKGWFIGGEPCERFEEHFAAYVGTRHCVACGNRTGWPAYDAGRCGCWPWR